MEDKLKDIINRAREIYMRYGIKSVTMDDMSRHLGISKKTLYQYVKDKKDLVMKTIESQLEDEICLINNCVQEHTNAIEQHIFISKSIISQMKNVQPAIFYDLKKYYPKAWDKFQRYKHEKIFNTILENIKLGINQKLYREDVNPEITAMLYIHSVDILFSDEMAKVMSGYNFQQIIIEKIKYHIYGISTEKGSKEFKKHLETFYE